MNLITVFAKREGTSVVIYNKDGSKKCSFPNTGYRPTRATKTVMINCWRFNLKWKQS